MYLALPQTTVVAQPDMISVNDLLSNRPVCHVDESPVKKMRRFETILDYHREEGITKIETWHKVRLA